MKAMVPLLLAATFLVALFGLAGTVAWWNGWVALLLLAVVGTATSRLIASVPGLAEERRNAAAMAGQGDRLLVRSLELALPLTLVVAALDVRFRWTPPIPATASVAAFVVMGAAAAVTYRAVAANAFFSSHGRIQKDRGHQVVSTGPYRIVRHPGYAGSALFNLLAPVALGSWLSLPPALAAAALLVYRTLDEDALLKAELPGYVAYASQVRYRLVPGVW